MRRIVVLTVGAMIGFGLVGHVSPRAASPPESPLSDYPGFGHDHEADEALYEQEEEEVERLISECMLQKGFLYDPEDSFAIDSTVTEDQYRDWVETGSDSNDTYVMSLSAAQRESYYMALTGVSDPYSEDAADLPDPDAPFGGGCSGEADRIVPGVYAGAGQLWEELEQMEDAIRSDPQMVDAENLWAACLNGLGQAFATHRELVGSLDQAMADVDLATLQDEELGQLEQEYEAALASSDSCDDQVGFGQAQVETIIRHETAFVETHRETLDAHKQRLNDYWEPDPPINVDGG